MFIVLTGNTPVLPHRKRRAKTLRWLALAAHRQGTDLYVVTPADVRMLPDDAWRLKGWCLHKSSGEWRRQTVTVEQPVWLDLMYLEDLKRYRKTYRRLKTAIARRGNHCSNPVLPGKIEIYRELNHGSITPGCVPQTRKVVRSEDVLKMLQEHRTVWLKPVHGSGGRNMVRIQLLTDQEYQVHGDAFYGKVIKATMSKGQLIRFIRKTIATRGYLVQEDVRLPSTQEGRKMDIRVTVQRDAGGFWRVTATTLRRSGRDAVATNFHAGGARLSITSSQSREWLSDASISTMDVKRAEIAAVRAATVLSAKRPTLGLLGVDVAPGRDCCFIYDCNSRPGRDILTSKEVRLLAKRLVSFATFLSNSQGNEPDTHEKHPSVRGN